MSTPDPSEAMIEAGGLKPCPFCGSRGQLFRRYPPSDQHPDGLWGGRCSNESCGVQVDPAERTVEAAIDAWNTRAMQSAHIPTPSDNNCLLGDECGNLSAPPKDRETDREALLCGANLSPIPADMVGCGNAIDSFAEAYRCTHCDVLFHKDCAEKHFASDNVLTEEMIDEIERRRLKRIAEGMR